MKKIISILTVLLLCTQTVLPIFADETDPTLLPIESAFTDADFLAAVQETIGKTNDEHIYKSDVENITELDVSERDIKDMHGIEYFTGLKTLMCYANEIEELDLSHNTELEVLDCSLNLNLKSLDVSNNTNLKNLDCSYSSVEELNLENNLLLEKLDTCQMKLTSLDVTKNKNLKRLDCSRNRLTELDLSNNTNLERVICSNNYMDNDASKSIIGYDAVVAKLGEPSKSGDRTSDFKYYPQRKKTKTYPYAITSLCLKDTSGADIEKPQANQSFIVEADIIKNEGRDEKDYLFVAVYDTDGALISLDYVKARFVVDGEFSFGFNIPAQEKTIGSVKAFVWNTFNSTEPLAESKTLSFDVID